MVGAVKSMSGYMDPIFLPVIGTILVAFIIYVTFSYKKTYSFWSSRGLKGPKPIPFFGNSLSYILNPVGDVDLSYRELYGNLYGVYDGVNPVLIVSDPEIIEKIFISNHNSFKAVLSGPSNDPLFSNLLSLKVGEDMKRIRSVFTSGLTQSKLKNCYFEKMNDTNDLIAYIKGRENECINIFNLTSMFMLNVLTQIFYGLDLDLFRESNHEFLHHARNQFDYFNTLQLFIADRLPFLSRFVPDKSVEANKYLTNFVTFAVKERIKLLEKTKEDNDHSKMDFLQHFMDSSLTKMEKIANAIFLLGASFDTTSYALSFVFYELGRNKHILNRVMKEIDDFFNDDPGKIITFDDLRSFVYLESCFMETLRLHPLDFRNYRISTEEVKIPTTNITIPAGVSINVSTYALHHDASNFDNPADFDPDRWSEKRKGSIKNCSFMSFGAGPRKCPGGVMASMISKIVLIKILRSYGIILSDGTEIKDPAGRLTSRPQNVWMKFVPRNIDK